MSCPPVSFTDSHAENTQFTHRLPERQRKDVFTINLISQRRDFSFCETSDLIPDYFNRFWQAEVHSN